MVDILLFMGQSNMAGRGIICEEFPEPAPVVIGGAGYEYRAITEPDKLMPIVEPFGQWENISDGIDDGCMKTGSMVSAFVNAYYAQDGKVPVVAVSASKGGSSIADWHEKYISDVINRLKKCRSFLASRNIYIRHIYMVWCQGETDGDLHTPLKVYFSKLRCLFDVMKDHGVEHIFMIQIGEFNSKEEPDRYTAMIEAQQSFAENESDVTMVADSFKTMRARGLMKDSFHYYQQAYNEVGTLAGNNAGKYAATDNIL